MNETANLKISIQTDEAFRLIVMSDIHGHPEWLDKALHEIELEKEDYLIILGDFINRGSDSFKVYQMIRQLEKRDRTYILKGNHELFIQHFLSDASHYDDLLSYFKSHYYETIAETMLTQYTLKDKEEDLEDIKSGQALYDLMNDAYQEMIDYFSHLPIMLTFNEMTFVHGGYDATFDGKDEWRYLKYDDYNTLSQVNDHLVIVGHWPTCNLRKDRYTNTPYINTDKKILFIDGGLGIKEAGELNIVTITGQKGQMKASFRQVNHFKTMPILKSETFRQEETVFVNYPDYDVTLVEKGSLWSRCKHHQSEHTFSIFTELLDFSNDQVSLKIDYVNRFFNLEEGQAVDVVKIYETCALVKYQGEFGFVWAHQVNPSKK